MAPSVEDSAAPHLEAVDDTKGIVMPDPLTVEGVPGRRAKAPQLRAGVAAVADIETFKGKGSHAHKPKARRWDNYINREAASRQPSSIKDAAKYLATPGLISLGGGLPSSENFPIDELTYKVPTLGHFSEDEVHAAGTILKAGKHDMAELKSAYDIATSLNYSQGHGSSQVLRWVVEHTEIIHNPPYADWSCTLTIGNTSSLDMLLRLFVKPGMRYITDEYTFSTAREAAVAIGYEPVGVAMDDEGMIPQNLDDILSNWDPAANDGQDKPFLVYMVPSGHNPTGATQSLQRRKELYAVAEKHDLLLLEDEPYYFLQMQPYTGNDAPEPPPKTHAEFLSCIIPSYLSLDVSGRVIRIDSFSKVLAPGFRIGWITASQQIVERFNRYSDVSTQGPSGFSQLALFKLLEEHWGHSGYIDWLIHMRLEYTQRRNTLLRACDRFLPQQIVRYKAPLAGMFHWMEIDYTQHPLYRAGKIGLVPLEERIWHAGIKKGVLLIRGSWFACNQRIELKQMFFRATFAAATSDKMVEAAKRFGETLREEFELEPLETNGHTNGAA